MQLARPAFAPHPFQFGRGMVRVLDEPSPKSAWGEDIRLFATTFLAGFLFVSILIA